jgi:hypothetical protein
MKFESVGRVIVGQSKKRMFLRGATKRESQRRASLGMPVSRIIDRTELIELALERKRLLVPMPMVKD